MSGLGFWLGLGFGGDGGGIFLLRLGVRGRLSRLRLWERDASTLRPRPFGRRPFGRGGFDLSVASLRTTSFRTTYLELHLQLATPSYLKTTWSLNPTLHLAYGYTVRPFGRVLADDVLSDGPFFDLSVASLRTTSFRTI